jgi:hypothetical protein
MFLKLNKTVHMFDMNVVEQGATWIWPTNRGATVEYRPNQPYGDWEYWNRKVGGILNNSHKDINELWTQATPCGSPQWFKVKPDRAQRTISQNMNMCY